jgi:protein-S-isoprenylcysteine O-methyltransferase Ste14
MTDAHLPSRLRLVRTALVRFLAGVLLIGALVFLPAGTIRFWQGWLYLAVLLGPLAGFGVVLFVKDPEMMARRMRMRESEAQQKKAIAALSVVIVASLIIAGLDRRCGWSAVPPVLVIVADAMILVGYLLFGLTIRENRFASRVVELQEGQAVISSGPYAVVRHPMYLATALMFTVTPLALGSYWALLVSVLFPVMLAVRINNEEAILREGLRGYNEYVRNVKYRLIPYMW